MFFIFPTIFLDLNAYSKLYNLLTTNLTKRRQCDMVSLSFCI